ncbi:MAG: hypothetical protein DMG71_11505 [Acidobacteria bacterium]|nr:MAG: hypothetical protein DMG71_11505 [Acidobacteriota bacterium]
MSTPRLGIPVLVLAAVICGLLALPAMASSQARIVRLSDVEGTVQIDRDAGQGYERAFLNMPIVQGTKLWTKEDGRAEVEFEDGTVVRIVPNTKINFSELSLRDSGGKLNTLNLQEGTAYVNFEGKKDDEFVINFGRESARLTHPAHFRVEMDDAEATLAVLKGSVDLQGPSGSFEVGKKQTATFDLADNDRHEIAKNFEQDPYDNWDKQQAQYHDRYFNNSSYSNSNYPYSYGVSDLNYYGSYYNVPGYGNMWQPYFAGPGFDPFMNGAWCWYPGYGYTFVSAYPWGWMPYRYGTWVFVPNFGWGWQPGGWNTWATIPRTINPPNRFVTPQPPVTGGRQTVVVGHPPVMPGNAPRRVMITQGSAGLGIPRGTVRNLPDISQRVATQGTATVRTAAPTRSVWMGPSSGSSSRGMGSSGRVSAPSPHMSAPHSSAPSHSAPASSSKH